VLLDCESCDTTVILRLPLLISCICLSKDLTYQPTVEDLNLSCAMASSSLVKNRRERVVNRNLQHAAQHFER